MKLNLFLASCLLSAGLVNFLPSAAQADSPVQKVLSSEAQGLESKLRTITVWSGAGANLNFIPTGEIVKKVWLDDPSQIVLDFDGPMCMQAGDGGGDNCENSAATVVHLKRIHPIEFPNLPQTASTLLSVVTQTSRGERKLYQFQIAYGSGKPQYHTVAIYPDSQATPNGGMNGLVQAQLQNVELGLRVAKSRNLLGRNQGNQRLELRVQNFLDLVSSGATPQSASQQVGVSMRLISKLASLGTANVAQQQAQLPSQNQTENLPPAPPTAAQRKRSPNTAAQRKRSPNTAAQRKRSPDRAAQRSLDSTASLPITELNQPKVSATQRWSQSEPPQASPNSVASPPVTELQQPKVPMNQPIGTNTSRAKQPSASIPPPGTRSQRRKAITSVPRSASRTPKKLSVTNTSFVVKKPLVTQTNSHPPSRVISQRRLITATSRASAQPQLYSQQAINDANAVAFGLAVARHKGQINPNTLTWKKAQGAIRQLRLGQSREEAARRSGIDMAILSQLIKWGQNRP